MIDLRDPALTADAVIHALALQPHPEGGYYRETWRDQAGDNSRGAGTSIHFLLREGEISAWHRVDAAELWVWQGGAPIALTISATGTETRTRQLGPDLGADQLPHMLVPKHHWQTAASLGRWTLACCVVAPAFRFEGFEMAPPDWQPGSDP